MTVRPVSNAAERLSRHRVRRGLSQRTEGAAAGVLTAKARPGVWRKNRREMSTHILWVWRAGRRPPRSQKGSRTPQVCVFRRAAPFGPSSFGGTAL